MEKRERNERRGERGGRGRKERGEGDWAREKIERQESMKEEE